MENIKFSIIIPAYNSEKFIGECLNSIFSQTYKNVEIIVVNDGSSDNTAEEAMNAGARVITHEVNKGKGRALKNAFAYVADNLPELEGVITIDGDGQHLLEDIVACGERMLECDDGVVLGCRDFNQPGIPPRSVAGNKTTSRFFRLLFNRKTPPYGRCL